MNHFKKLTYVAGEYPLSCSIETLIDKVKACQYLFLYLDEQLLDHNYLFELGVAAAFSKPVFIYVQEGADANFTNSSPLHQFGARDIFNVTSRDEAYREFSRILGYPFKG